MKMSEILRNAVSTHLHAADKGSSPRYYGLDYAINAYLIDSGVPCPDYPEWSDTTHTLAIELELSEHDVYMEQEDKFIYAHLIACLLEDEGR